MVNGENLNLKFSLKVLYDYSFESRNALVQNIYKV